MPCWASRFSTPGGGEGGEQLNTPTSRLQLFIKEKNKNAFEISSKMIEKLFRSLVVMVLNELNRHDEYLLAISEFFSSTYSVQRSRKWPDPRSMIYVQNQKYTNYSL